MEHLLIAAKAEGLSVAQLAARINERVTAKPPDHLLLVEPEHGMGELLKYEVLKATGRKSLSYSIPELRSRPELLTGAALLVPGYLVDLLDFVHARQRFAVTMLLYSPFGGYIEQVRNLASPTLIGMISVSGPGMKTMDGMFAEAIGSRHQLIHFWMECPIQPNGRVVIHRLTSKQLPPDIDVRLLGRPGSDRANATPDSQPQPKAIRPADLPLATMADLRSVDLLFCDSIAYDAVEHPNRFKYQLLSPESLREIAAVNLGTNEA
jgi:hypothetical protein